MRSWPPRLQDTLMMMVAAMYELADRGGDWVGASIYASSAAHGFRYCVVAGTVTSVLIAAKEQMVAPLSAQYMPEDGGFSDYWTTLVCQAIVD